MNTGHRTPREAAPAATSNRTILLAAGGENGTERRSPLRASWRLGKFCQGLLDRSRWSWMAAALVMAACGPAMLPPGTRVAREVIVAHDDNHGTANLHFPNLTYESIVRFAIPAGKHRALRLRLMAEAAGTIAITFYENSVLECPGQEIQVITRELVKDDLSDGKDGRWVVEDLRDLPPLDGVVWVGMRKLGGEPSLWTSAVVSGQVYLRDRDPSHGLGLLPVKRTPMVRLELLP